MNEEIKQLIEEEAREYAFQQYKDDEFTETILFNETINDFKAGASFILHQNRWRKVEEEMPEHRNNDYQVLGLLNNGHYITIWIIKGISQIEMFTYHGITEWKPIE